MEQSQGWVCEGEKRRGDREEKHSLKNIPPPCNAWRHEKKSKKKKKKLDCLMRMILRTARVGVGVGWGWSRR